MQHAREIVPVVAMVGVYALRRASPRVPTWMLPIVAVAIATLAQIAGIAISESEASLLNGDALVDSLVQGLAAAGLWSAAGRHVMPLAVKDRK